MAAASKRRSNKISVLIVPEDNAEPYTFRIRTSVVKALYVLGVVLLIHIIVGGVYYWKYAHLVDVQEKLVAYNRHLQEDNKRVIALSEKFYALEKEYRKVKSLLGVETELPPASQMVASTGGSRLFDTIVPATKVNTADPGQGILRTAERFFLSPKKSKTHHFADNVPTLLPVQGFLTQGFYKNGWFGARSHTGIDIVAKTGSIIRAAGSGTIIFANWTYDLGNLIIIDHGTGMLSYYGHNQRILRPEKSYVKKGEAIALMGSTGRSSGPHLHFEIWKDGNPVNPTEYLVALNGGVATN